MLRHRHLDLTSKLSLGRLFSPSRISVGVLFLLMALSLGCSSNGSITNLFESSTPSTLTPVTPVVPGYSLTVCDATITTQYGAGDGTVNYPYQLCNATQWKVLQSTSSDWGKSFKLAADINFVGVTTMAPIGDLTTAFTGTFDGNGKTLSNISFAPSAVSGFGIFGVVAGATIKNLVLSGVSINANGFSSIGALIGTVSGASTVSNVTATGITITNGLNLVGGLIGNHMGLLERASITGAVSGTGNSIGGLVGYSNNFGNGTPLTQVSESSANVVVSGGAGVGGAIGEVSSGWGNIEIKNLTAAGSIQGTAGAVGGLIGIVSYANLTDTSATGSVSAVMAGVGGLIGSCSYGTIIRSFATGSVTGGAGTGGFMGANTYCSMSLSYAKGNVAGTTNVGGFVGSATASAFLVPTISFCYAQGSASASAGRAGGFAGYSKETTISYSYATGTGGVTGTLASGGLVGFNDTGATITLSYFDKVASGLTAMCGTVGGTGCNNTFGKTTTELQTLATYAGSIYWNFIGAADGMGDEWKLPASSYPKLYWEDPQPGDLATFTAGSGTTADPYLITTAAELNQIGYTMGLMRSSFKVANNIDLSSLGSYPMIGDINMPFAGVFDGNGKTLSNLTINKPAVNYVGLFSYINGGLVKDLTLTGFSVTGNTHVGMIAGAGYSASLFNISTGGAVSGVTKLGGAIGSLLGGSYGLGYFSNVSTSGTVNGSSHDVGGLLGYAQSLGFISASSSSATVVGVDYVGGLVGESPFAILLSIQNSFATGNVTGNNEVGGLVGYHSYTTSGSYATGNVSGNSNVGGLIGHAYSSSATVMTSYATGNVTATSTQSGGLIGFQEWHARVLTSYATGSVTGTQRVGGLVGQLQGTLYQAYSKGAVLGDHIVGGLIGLSNQYASDVTPLHDCYSVSSVTGRNGVATQYIGGLIGSSNTNLNMNNLYYAGILTKGTGVTTQAAGGLVGYNTPSGLGNFTATFWNQTLNPTLNDIGGASDAITDHAGITASTTTNLTDPTAAIFTGAGWDFTLLWAVDTGAVNGGYPVLRP